MLRLILVRHAKAAAGLADFDRPLAPRGQREARWVGETLRAEGWLPDLVLCSSALRTRQTLALSEVAAPTVFEREIYDLMDEDFVDCVRRRGGAAARLALVGHNSAINTTAQLLASEAVEFGGYPPAAIAVLDFAIDDWSALARRTGALVAFRAPPRD